MDEACIFCAIADRRAPAGIVCEDDRVLAIVDRRQFHPGHVLVMPRRHMRDVRDLDDDTGAALMSMLTRITRAVGRAFPHDGLSLWHSIGAAAGQEVMHLHVHVHPRLAGDDLLKVYPRAPVEIGQPMLDTYAGILQAHL